MLTWIMDYQKETYLAFGEHISTFANGGGSAAFFAFLPMGLLLGAVHALMPGHSKLLMATYVFGSKGGPRSALLTALVLAATHITISVLIVLLSLPLIDYMFGGSGPGSSPLLEHLSRGVIGLIGLWMIWRGLRSTSHNHRPQEGAGFGFVAGLIPCPLTLFVMTYATARGVPAAGLLFAVLMLGGVALTLSVVALLAVSFRKVFYRLFSRNQQRLDKLSRVLEITVGLGMVAVATMTLA
ncbi:ABC transporter permease [Agrobacterium tumefaciens]|jgi:nickel/cobalt exporter|uniref:urease accessory protein UreH domain-containing protein n=1 Tax=Agrobacterium tumefaciens TaxID=358 RepID=UPI0015745EBA|nr:ABC transporter permease [Agrobacterium tumefaciens]